MCVAAIFGMGCCLTKKSRENRIKKDKNPLLKDGERVLSSNEQRGVSLQFDKPNTLQQTHSITSQDQLNPDYEPPNPGNNENKFTKVVVGKSLLDSPSVDDLYKAEMIEKRGHLIRNWKKRYIVLHDGEIQYFDQADKSGKGVGFKGQIHLLGAYCDLKTDSDGLPTLEIVGRQGEKDLLLKFMTFAKAREWAEAVNWTIYGWNTRCIESGEEIPEITKWYTQQLAIFEESFTLLTGSCQFNEHKINHLNGQLVISPVILQGIRQDLCLAVSGKGTRTRKIIPLVEIIDVITGSYADDDIPMISISTKALGTMNFQLIEDCDQWMDSFRRVLMFLQMPVPQGMKSIVPPANDSSTKKSKKTRKVSTNL